LRIFERIAVPAGLLAAALALNGCSGSKPATTTAIYNPETSNLPGAMSSNTGGSLFTFGKGSSGGANQTTQIQVNAYLWRATLDTLSFMPLVSADPFGGVIITDWYVPPATPDERFKVNAYILGKQLTANAVQVSGERVPPGRAKRPMDGLAGRSGDGKRSGRPYSGAGGGFAGGSAEHKRLGKSVKTLLWWPFGAVFRAPGAHVPTYAGLQFSKTTPADSLERVLEQT
jgi:hypothetical protein